MSLPQFPSPSRSPSMGPTAPPAAGDPSYPPLVPGGAADPPPAPAYGSFDVPWIDLGNLDHQRLRDACRSLGLFRLTNHGLPSDLSVRIRAAARGIFERPFDRKRAEMAAPESGRPATYFWGTPVVSLSLRSVNWMEGLQVPLAVFSDGDGDGDGDGDSDGDGGSVDDAWSDFVRIVKEEYGRHMTRIVQTLFDSLAVQLSLDPTLSESYVDASDGFFRAYRYPRVPESQSLLGMTAHTDSSVLTVVDQDETGGLQIRYENAWFDVAPIAGTLIVNVGDMLQAISGDEYRSTEHRVVANGRRERISLCFFAFPKEDFKIRSNNYKEFTYREFKAQVEEDIKKFGDKVGLKRFIL